MSIVPLSLSLIQNNPFRDFAAHPISPAQVEALKASMELTAFWDGLLVRPSPYPTDYYQLAFGHTRLEAARQMGHTQAYFNVVELTDDQMIQHMALENLTQFGRDQYASYREAVSAAIERILHTVLQDPSALSQWVTASEAQQAAMVSQMRMGGAPGIAVLMRYFGGVLSQKAIGMAIDEYRSTGRLAAWHQKHNPDAVSYEAKTLDPQALGMFAETAHVRAFADTVRLLEVPPCSQAALAERVLSVLREPELKHKSKSQVPENIRLAKQYARREQPANERITSRNIRSVARMIVADTRRSPKERKRIAAEAHAISIEGSLTELAFGLARASGAASELARVCGAIGGLQVDLTATALRRLESSRESLKAIEKSLKRAGKAGYRFGMLGA